jgi:DNA processing protein
MDAHELKAWLRLLLLPGIGNHAARVLLSAFGSPQAVFEQTATTLIQRMPAKLVAVIQTEPARLGALLQTTQQWLALSDDRRVVALGDADYPASLLQTEDPPLLLHLLGLPLDSRCAASLAMVGSRNPTPQGALNAKQFAQEFASAGLCIVSGLALGIDGAAHAGAIAGGGNTVAVVGTGLDQVYPRQHQDLARQIAQQGTLVSEYCLGTPPLSANFPRRNRIISGLSQGVLVVEAALKSGSLITAGQALEQGREVFAIPGSIHSPQSRGCHALIKQGAKLVETASDVLEELKLTQCSKPTESHNITNQTPPNPLGQTLLTALGMEVLSLDQLQARTGLATAVLQAGLLDLEIDEHLARLAGGRFQRLVRT